LNITVIDDIMNNDNQTESEPAGKETAEEVQAATGQPSQEPTNEELAEALARTQQELAQKQAEASEYLDNWRRAAAELSNARKRMLREQEESRALAGERILEKLLPIVDDIDRAFAALPPDEANSQWIDGFRAIQRKMNSLLESEGVTPIETNEKTFDPALHYAVTHEEVEGYEEGQIIGEAARGYTLRDKVLRPSMVRVAKGNSNKT
jgi:molecular chaperone GrpE